MTDRARSERKTQNRIIRLFTDDKTSKSLRYEYLGDWTKRENNSQIEPDLLTKYLKKQGYSDAHISAALHKLNSEADITGTTLYETNLRVYQLLRYGIQVQISAGQSHDTVNLIDWENPTNNDFGLAEEVTLRSGHQRRPDLVIYINGIAIAVIELKRSSVEVADGIRQLITNQEKIFNQFFFSTVQLVLAGNDSQGLYYGTTGTSEKIFVKWKNENQNVSAKEGSILDEPLTKMCNKSQLLDLIYKCIIFDSGQKKVPRPHQYYGFKAAQDRILNKNGGVIWHTQGSGKSILMIMLAKWILEHDPNARILIVTDRDELDKQIEETMINSGLIATSDPKPRITTRADFIDKLTDTKPRVLCALIHKFDPEDLKSDPPKVHGQFYVFVDECHRTQGGDMNLQMKRWLDKAIFIGFTGTPLLKSDKQNTRKVFGSYIHTYKFHQAVEDKVILDLKYESRSIPQRLGNQKAIDDYFENKTRGLNNFQKAKIKNCYATLEHLMSSQERKHRIIASIIEDFNLKPRLSNNRGTAFLVTSSIYDACHYYRLFQNQNFAPFVGITTSFEPNHNKISREPPSSVERYKYDTYTQYVLRDFKNTEKYETEIKRRFIKEPANTKLLIVVSKLLTGFDAPSCSYIYLDNKLHDHNLFQAICRTNRLDGEDKTYGYIVDFKSLLKEVQEAIAIYNSEELDIDEDGSKNNIEIKDAIKEGRKQLDFTRKNLYELCNSILPSREVEKYIEYFCGGANNPDSLTITEPLRISFYKATAAFIRAYSEVSMSNELGYSDAEANDVYNDVDFFSDIRSAIKKHSGEELDIKPYEADMRHLLNTYVQADPAELQGNLNSLSLTEMIIKTGIHDAIALKLNQKKNLSKNSISEAIINNIRKTIIRDQLTDPRFYQEMSTLLNDLIAQNIADEKDYEEFLKNAEELVKKLSSKNIDKDISTNLNGKKEVIIIYRNLKVILRGQNLSDNDLSEIALKIDQAMKERAPAGWRGDQAREAQVLNALYPLLKREKETTIKVFELIKNQPEYYL